MSKVDEALALEASAMVPGVNAVVVPEPEKNG